MENTVFVLIYLNSIFPCRRGKWDADTIFSHFPSVEEILDHSCLESSNPNDVEMAKKLVETKGLAHRFVYKNNLNFFECMIVEKELGKPLDLYEYFITGYADMDENRQIQYKSYESYNKKNG